MCTHVSYKPPYKNNVHVRIGLMLFSRFTYLEELFRFLYILL